METVRIRVRDGKKSDPGSGMETVRIRDGKKSDPGSTFRILNTGFHYIYEVYLIKKKCFLWPCLGEPGRTAAAAPVCSWTVRRARLLAQRQLPTRSCRGEHHCLAAQHRSLFIWSSLVAGRVVDPHWFQGGYKSSILGQCGSGSRSRYVMTKKL